MNQGSKPGFLDQEEPTCTKIYYASRTHSQLTQIIPELLKLKLSPVSSPLSSSCSTPLAVPQKRSANDTLDRSDDLRAYTRTVSLGSRKQLCINHDLRSRKRDLDEGCREMLDGAMNLSVAAQALTEYLAGKGKRCQYLPTIDEEARMLDLRDQILVVLYLSLRHLHSYVANKQASPKDIEDLAEAGRLSNTCPYFGSRRAIRQAEVIAVVL